MFETILGVSLGGAFFIALVLCLRPLLTKICGYLPFYILWICVMVCLLLPFGTLLPLPSLQVQVPVDRYGVEMDLDKLTYTITDANAVADTENPLSQLNYFNYEEYSAFTYRLTASTVLTVLWSAGILVFLLYHLIRANAFRKKCAKLSALPATGELLRMLSNAKRRCKVKRKVKLCIVRDIPCPMTRGFFRPVIYMPHDIVFPDAQYLLLCHEMVLIKRKTALWKGLAYLASALHWFNPFVHIVRKQMAVDAKMAADTKVLEKESLRARESYIAALDSVNCDSELADYFYVSPKAARLRRDHILANKKKSLGFLLLLPALPLLLCSIFLLQIGFGDMLTSHWKTTQALEISDSDPAKAAELYIKDAGDGIAADIFRQIAFTIYSGDGDTATCLFAVGEEENWLLELKKSGDLWQPYRYQILNDNAAKLRGAEMAYAYLYRDFSYPAAPKAVAEAWAEAYSKSNGAVQYHLLSDSNRQMVEDYFKSRNWFTNNENVVSYEISEETLAYTKGYDIIFQRKDSAGNALPAIGYFIGVEDSGGKWQITEIDTICNSVEGKQVLVPAYPLLAAMADVVEISGLTPPQLGESVKETGADGKVSYLLTSQIKLYSDSPPVYTLSETKADATKIWSYQIYPKYYQVLSVPE